MRHSLYIILLLLHGLHLTAQEEPTRMHSTLYGFGMANILDSYLSPYSYKGIEARIIRQTSRPTRLWNGHISYNTQIDANAAYVGNPAGNVKEYAGGIRYTNAWLYNLKAARPLTIAAGAAVSGYAGGIYNKRGGNNPAQAKLDLTIDLAAQADYRFRVGRREWQVRYNLTIPLTGIAFSPQYGQGYYEIFTLHDYDHNCVFVTPLNMPSMRHLLTLDIPLGRNHIRVGYAGEFMQTRFNGLHYHAYSHNFMIGFTKYFVRL